MMNTTKKPTLKACCAVSALCTVVLPLSVVEKLSIHDSSNR
ncbi:hypothetical protein V2J64_09690 [Staphylococcus saccharolyticus]